MSTTGYTLDPEILDPEAFMLFESGVVKTPNHLRGKQWKDLTLPEKTIFYRAAESLIRARDLRTSKQFHDPENLAVWAEDHGLRRDWHEPDESGVGARVIGDHLDNAFGSGLTQENGFQEYVVVLTVNGRDSARINLANLLAWATERGQSL